MSSAEEPLIAASEVEAVRNSFVEDDNGGEAHSAPWTQPRDASPVLFIWLLAFSAGISGLLFGCKWVQLRKSRRAVG